MPQQAAQTVNSSGFHFKINDAVLPELKMT
jgi:hypothetical protein